MPRITEGPLRSEGFWLARKEQVLLKPRKDRVQDARSAQDETHGFLAGSCNARSSTPSTTLQQEFLRSSKRFELRAGSSDSEEGQVREPQNAPILAFILLSALPGQAESLLPGPSRWLPSDDLV